MDLIFSYLNYSISTYYFSECYTVYDYMRSKFSIRQRKALRNKTLFKPRRSKRSKVLLGVLITIAAGSIFLLAMPYLPRLYFLVFRPKIDATPYQKAAEASKKGQTVKPVEEKPGNRLVLPGIGVDTQILEGRSINVIGKNQGVWHETSKLNPTIDGNIVIAGHRFLYTATNGGWFYNLPELKIGSKIYIRWEGKVYEYQIHNTRSVLPTQVDIRDTDPNVPRKLTLYTCYPLGSTAKRYVVEAKQL